MANTTSWQITTPLTMHTVPALDQEQRRNRPAKGQWLVDCNHHDMDSAGIALLLQIIRQTKHQQLSLQLQGINAKAESLMQAQGVWPLITPYTKEQ